MNSEAHQLETYGPLVDAEEALGMNEPGRLRKVFKVVKNISTRVATVLAGLTAAGAVVAACSGDGSFSPIDGGENVDEMVGTMPEPPEDSGPEDMTPDSSDDAEVSCNGDFIFEIQFPAGEDVRQFLVWPDGVATTWDELDQSRIGSLENPEPEWGEPGPEDDPYFYEYFDKENNVNVAGVIFNPNSYAGETFPYALYRPPDGGSSPVEEELYGCDTFRGVEGTTYLAPLPPPGYYDPQGWLVNAADEELQVVCFVLPPISPIPDTTEEPPSLIEMPNSCFSASDQDLPIPANSDPIFIQRPSF